eukprot:TRINITY_DN5545_c0_g1_i1.p1 TRINITY_DN5545_c0_g1~~TRINITY_DN5545_c0_g1_i1.p1  ORF type:complete len:310 (-),score=38.64 TRINITY_DN5545_c0_g1_i1:278-1207(-)
MAKGLKIVQLLLVSMGISVSASSKRGIADPHLSHGAVEALHPAVSWGYNWGTSAGWSGLEFFPMIHHASSLNSADHDLHGHFSALLGFNEPDISSQAHMSPREAARRWPKVEKLASAHGVQSLVSPAVCGDIGKGTSWLQEFFDACHGCRVDAVAIHSYWPSLSGVQGLVRAHRRWGKPLWITEIACEGCSHGRQIEFMKEVVPWLEQEGVIAKYAWFNPMNRLVAGSHLTELGRAYLGHGHGDQGHGGQQGSGDCCASCGGKFCSPRSGHCHNQQSKSYYLECPAGGRRLLNASEPEAVELQAKAIHV